MYMLYVRMREKKEEVFYDRNECEIAESCFSGVVVKKKKMIIISIILRNIFVYKIMEGEGGVEEEIYDLAMLAKRGFFFLRAEERRLKKGRKEEKRMQSRTECGCPPTEEFEYYERAHKNASVLEYLIVGVSF